MLVRLDLYGLRAAVSVTSEDTFAKWIERQPATKTEPAMRIEKPSKVQYLDQLAQLHTIACIGHGWTSRRGGRTMLHSSRSLIGVDGMRGIILDATAEIDPTYSVMRDQVDLMPRPTGIRIYQNVTLHVSHGQGRQGTPCAERRERMGCHLGRLVEAASWKARSPHLRAQRSRPAIEQYRPKDGYVHFDNRGNLDGRNDWNRCEAAILFGLPYLDKSDQPRGSLPIKARSMTNGSFLRRLIAAHRDGPSGHPFAADVLCVAARMLGQLSRQHRVR